MRLGWKSEGTGREMGGVACVKEVVEKQMENKEGDRCTAGGGVYEGVGFESKRGTVCVRMICRGTFLK